MFARQFNPETWPAFKFSNEWLSKLINPEDLEL